MSRTQTSSTASSGTASPTSGTASPTSGAASPTRDWNSVSLEEHISNSDDISGLETWDDPTPRPSTFTLNELMTAFVAAAKRQLILKPKSPSREERIRRRIEHDRKSLMIALNAYARQNLMQPGELEFVHVKERNLIDEEGKGYVHFNFLVLKRLDDTCSVFFAEVHPDCREEQDVYVCSPLEESDCGQCFGCKDRAKDLRHPSSQCYLGGHKNVGFPFMVIESDEDSEDEN